MATTIDLTALVLSADGVPVADGTTLGKLLSNEIMSSSINEEPMKYFDWALDLRKSGVIIVDNTDKQKLVTMITNSSTLNVLGKGRLLSAINDAVDSAKTGPPSTVTAPIAITAPEVVEPEQLEQSEQQVSEISQETV